MRTFFLCIFSSVAIFATDYEGSIQQSYRVNLIELDVKVEDWRGDFVSGLTAEDFIVKENGEIQNIDQIDEMDLANLSKDEQQDYQSRIMILLDYQNTRYANMTRAFKQLKSFIQGAYDGKSEIGIAVNDGGIGVVTSFTNDRETLMAAVDQADQVYRKSRFRTGLHRTHFNQRNPFFDRNPFLQSYQQKSHHHNNGYYREQLEILNQFVHYLSAFTGKKNMVLVTDSWPTQVYEGGENDRSVASIHDIQTSCLHYKIALNVVSFNDPLPGAQARLPRTAYKRHDILDPTVHLASATAGHYYNINQQNLGRIMGKASHDVARYYRIRYYSNYNGPKYRRVKVKAVGPGMAHTVAGYFPKPRQIEQKTGNAWMNVQAGKGIELSVGTDWMYWEWAGWKKRRANYLISKHVYDTNGQLLDERIYTGQLEAKKIGDEYTKDAIQTQLKLDPSPAGKPGRAEVMIMDLNTGERVKMEHRF